MKLKKRGIKDFNILDYTSIGIMIVAIIRGYIFNCIDDNISIMLGVLALCIQLIRFTIGRLFNKTNNTTL